MGRKRTSTKRKVTISVENELYEKLVALKINRSVLFTDAALQELEKIENMDENKKI